MRQTCLKFSEFLFCVLQKRHSKLMLMKFMITFWQYDWIRKHNRKHNQRKKDDTNNRSGHGKKKKKYEHKCQLI